MECFFDIGITNGMFLSHCNNKWNGSCDIRLAITNGMDHALALQ